LHLSPECRSTGPVILSMAHLQMSQHYVIFLTKSKRIGCLPYQADSHKACCLFADPQPSVASSRPVDTLRSHVAQAQARANHIVDEFESMLLVTGGHSMKEVMHIQSQAGLAEGTPPAAAAAAASTLPLVSLPSLLLMLPLCKGPF